MTSGGPHRRPPVPALTGLVPVPTYRDRPATPASDVSGTDLAGSPVEVGVLGTGRWTVLVFLSSSCDGCADFWEAAADPRAAGLTTDEALVVVTHGPDYEDVAAVVRLAPQDPPPASPLGGAALVVMSESAWSTYRVQGPPFFVLVDGCSDRVVTEGVAWGVRQVGEHLRSARSAQAAEADDDGR